MSSKFFAHVLSSILTMDWIFWMTNLIRDVEIDPVEKIHSVTQPKKKALEVSGTRFYLLLLKEFVAFVGCYVFLLAQLFIKNANLDSVSLQRKDTIGNTM